jgi:hypothetical protein
MFVNKKIKYKTHVHIIISMMAIHKIFTPKYDYLQILEGQCRNSGTHGHKCMFLSGGDLCGFGSYGIFGV